MPPPVIIGPRANRRVTCDLSPSNDRSESSIAANPLDPYNLVGASKRFTNPATYAFSLAAYASFDGGLSWTESAPLTLLQGWAGTSDPSVAWDDVGNAYLVALPFAPSASPTDYVGAVIGIAVYKSVDGGRSWGAPNLIHTSAGDDKQWTQGDGNPGSPYYGNVYAVWDNGSQLAFARTSDHGGSWQGVGAQPVGSPLASDSFSPEVSVAADGTVYIVWIAGGGTSIKFVKSTDGGDSFTAPAVAVSGITPVPFKLPGGTFRVFSLPSLCAGSGNVVVTAWADYRDGVSRIYYRRSTNGGNSWSGAGSGQPLLDASVASAADQHDFHPQIVSTPDGDIGCTFYEFGPRGPGGTPPRLIDVVLAVSINNGISFKDRVNITDQAWDPAVDAPLAHGDPTVTFIGDYFGLDASRLGFFPLWTDTRTGVQELYCSRISVRPADVYIRDSSLDLGVAPSPGFHWEAPDLIVRRQQDGGMTFVNEDLLHDGVTDHYVYGRVTNNGPNAAENVRLAVTVGNYPSLIGLPGTEFRYPQDWYPGDWSTPAVLARHLFLGEGPPMNIPSGQTKVLGPVLWPAAQIPPQATWHPCLLAEARADNNDAAGGPNGAEIDADADPCVYGSYFWGSNNVCQRNLSYATVIAGLAHLVELPFLAGSEWSTSSFLELIVDKGHELRNVPMSLRLEPTNGRVDLPRQQERVPELVLVDGGRALVRVGGVETDEFVGGPGTVWRPTLPGRLPLQSPEHSFGAERHEHEWKLTASRAAVGFPVVAGQLHRMTLSFRVPASLEQGTHTIVRIFQRNDKRQITGSVLLDIECRAENEAHERPTKRRSTRRSKGGSRKSTR
jgi:hypothetical protein